MKKTVVLALLCLVNIVCFSQQKKVQHRFSLEGTIDCTAKGTVYFRYDDAKDRFVTDSALLEDNHFKIKGFINGPTIAFLSTTKKALPQDDDEDAMKADGKNSTLFFLEPSAMKAKLHTDNFRNASFTGSFTQSQYAKYTNKLNIITDEYKAGTDSVNAITALDKEQKAESIQRLANIRNAASSDLLHHFINNNPHSYITAYLVSGSHFKLDSLNHYYSRLPLPVKLSAYGKIIKEKIHQKEKLSVGRPAPQFKQATSTGDSVALKDFLGKYVLLQFWSSTNNASRAENQQLIALYNQFKNKNFVIIGISVDGQKTKLLWKAALEKDQLPWMQLAALKSSHNQAVMAYDVQSVPANFLIGPGGKIAGADMGVAKLSALLGKTLK